MTNIANLVQDDAVDTWQIFGFLSAGADKLQTQEELSVIPPPFSRFSRPVLSWETRETEMTESRIKFRGLKMAGDLIVTLGEARCSATLQGSWVSVCVN